MVLNVIGAIVITLAVYYGARFVLDIDLAVFPDWAQLGS